MPSDPLPGPDDFRGRLLSDQLRAFFDWMRRNNVLTDPSTGIVAQPTAGGRLLRILAQAIQIRTATSDHGAIAPQTQGTVTLYTDVTCANLTSPAVTLQVVNPYHTRTCPANSPVVWILTVGSVNVLTGWEC